MMTRSQRKAAVVTSTPISDMFLNKILNNEVPFEAPFEAPSYKTDGTIGVLHYLINECDEAKFEDDRVIIVNKLFKYIIEHPDIIIMEPKFRAVAVAKMREVQNYIYERKTLYKQAEYFKAIDMFKNSVSKNIKNSKMRSKIYNHLNDIRSVMGEYANWSEAVELKNTFARFDELLVSIKSGPNYVPYPQ